MRIVFTKLSDERHRLEVERGDGRRDSVECETRSFLQHDLLHYAAEVEARLKAGFWGSLADGRTLAEMNDRTGTPMPAMMTIEKAVGVLSGAVKGHTAEQVVLGYSRYVEGIGESVPEWFTVEFVEAVQERMRRLTGRWRATPYGDAMVLEWPSA